MQDSLKVNVSKRTKMCIYAVIGFCFFVIIFAFVTGHEMALNILAAGLIGAVVALLIHMYLYRDWRLWVCAFALLVLSAATVPFIPGYIGPVVDVFIFLAIAGLAAAEAFHYRGASLQESQVMRDVRMVNGRQLKIRVHKDDTREPDFAVIHATIEAAAFLEDGRSFFIVRPNSSCSKGEDLVIDRMALLGMNSNLIQELFGISRRAPTWPVVAGMYRLRDDAMKEEALSSKAIPTSSEYLGRAAIFLDPNLPAMSRR